MTNPWTETLSPHIGGGGDPESTWPGILDEVRMWNRALSDAEIDASMKAGLDQFRTTAGVKAAGRLAVTWGSLKRLPEKTL